MLRTVALTLARRTGRRAARTALRLCLLSLALAGVALAQQPQRLEAGAEVLLTDRAGEHLVGYGRVAEDLLPLTLSLSHGDESLSIVVVDPSGRFSRYPGRLLAGEVTLQDQGLEWPFARWLELRGVALVVEATDGGVALGGPGLDDLPEDEDGERGRPGTEDDPERRRPDDEEDDDGDDDVPDDDAGDDDEPGTDDGNDDADDGDDQDDDAGDDEDDDDGNDDADDGDDQDDDAGDDEDDDDQDDDQDDDDDDDDDHGDGGGNDDEEEGDD